ncbi:hypothetical protein [Rhizobium sp. YS-1r]|uniref:hypothetical protein n=1 Tax=Rhizobium sp. YS-1r TaxID=1532558 RepID=UPI00050E8E78|nr:hypothetical protein [Rhizobium sp. YS-1r]KGE00994.1 hypothetical protein JL39_07570 [Rhizobium sp. YS-1r]
MKFGKLKSIGHNIADSLASGIGLMIGVYETDVFGESAKSPEGYILVDFIAGTSSGAQPSASLARAIDLYAQALDDLCQRHGVRADAFRVLTARYSVDRHGCRFVVTVVDHNGRSSTDEYLGTPGRRVTVRDEFGRVRPKRHQTSQNAE